MHDDLSHAIAAGVADLGQRLPDGASDKMARLLGELQRWNARVNLTAIRDPAAMVSGHILDSLAARPFVHGQRLIDVGTGAGFPGLPLALAEPQLRVALLERNGRKVGFLRHIVGELGIANATVVHSRAEDYAPADRFDTVVGRALAATRQFIDIAGHLLADDGVLLALKGKYPDAELAQLIDLPDSWDCSVTELTVPGLAQHSRHIVCLRRRGALRT